MNISHLVPWVVSLAMLTACGSPAADNERAKGTLHLDFLLINSETDISALIQPRLLVNGDYVDPSVDDWTFDVSHIQDWPAEVTIQATGSNYQITHTQMLENTRKRLAIPVALSLIDVRTTEPGEANAVIDLVGASTGAMQSFQIDTDGSGRFLAQPGQYRLQVRRDGVSFPSIAVDAAPGQSYITVQDTRLLELALDIDVQPTLPNASDLAYEIALRPVADADFSGPKRFGQRKGALNDPVTYSDIVPGAYVLDVLFVEPINLGQSRVMNDAGTFPHWRGIPLQLEHGVVRQSVALALDGLEFDTRAYANAANVRLLGRKSGASQIAWRGPEVAVLKRTSLAQIRFQRPENIELFAELLDADGAVVAAIEIDEATLRRGVFQKVAF